MKSAKINENSIFSIFKICVYNKTTQQIVSFYLSLSLSNLNARLFNSGKPEDCSISKTTAILLLPMDTKKTDCHSLEKEPQS